VSLYGMLKGRGPSGFGYQSTAEEVTQGIDLTGKSYLLTGCGSGLGLETLRVLRLRGAHVVALARTEENAKAALASCNADGTPLACDLSEPASVGACVARVRELGRRFDGIICNAGIMALPRLEHKHGLEMQFLVNHIGHFLLVTGLLDRLADEGRVVVLSSAAHFRTVPGGIEFDNLSGERGYGPWKAYGQSKLANLLMAKQLARRLAGTGHTANAVHPGVIRTRLGRHMSTVARGGMALVEPLFFKHVEQGAATQCYVAIHPAVRSVTGEYFADCNIARPSRYGADLVLAERLWEASEQIAQRIMPSVPSH
jgi:NAD(P)-dependent dehydrogenase (short-subunit alcohol dehydrogenase family)